MRSTNDHSSVRRPRQARRTVPGLKGSSARKQNRGLRRWAMFFAMVVGAGLFFGYRHQLRRQRPRGIVLHHTASAGRINGELVGARMIDEWHARRGFWKEYKGRVYHIGYHYVIRVDGMVENGRPEGCRGAHATHGNDCVGICLVGNFTRKARGKTYPAMPTRAQMTALHRLVAELVDQYHLAPDQIYTHREVDGDTACPGDLFPIDQVRKWVREIHERNSLASIFR